MVNLLAEPFIHKLSHAILKTLFVQSTVDYAKMKLTVTLPSICCLAWGTTHKYLSHRGKASCTFQIDFIGLME